MKRRLGWILASAIALGACGGRGYEERPAGERPMAEDSRPEEGLLRVEAATAARLSIDTGRVDSASVPPTWSHSGQIVPLPGRAIVVIAPASGSVVVPGGGALPVPGRRVAKGDTLLELLPVDQDSVTVDVGSVDADESESETEPSPVAVVAPDAGVIRTINVSPGQEVSAGAGLVEVVGVDRLWVRVVLNRREARTIARSEPATVSTPGRSPRLRSFTAQPMVNQTFVDALSGSVDLFYEIRGAVHLLRPGERISVALPLARPKGRALVAPLAAIVVDGRGGTWVYQRLDSLTFARRRIRVSRVVADQVILDEGPTPGTTIVTAGSPDLFALDSTAVK